MVGINIVGGDVLDTHGVESRIVVERGGDKPAVARVLRGGAVGPRDGCSALGGGCRDEVDRHTAGCAGAEVGAHPACHAFVDAVGLANGAYIDIVLGVWAQVVEDYEGIGDIGAVGHNAGEGHHAAVAHDEFIAAEVVALSSGPRDAHLGYRVAGECGGDSGERRTRIFKRARGNGEACVDTVVGDRACGGVGGVGVVVVVLLIERHVARHCGVVVLVGRCIVCARIVVDSHNEAAGAIIHKGDIESEFVPTRGSAVEVADIDLRELAERDPVGGGGERRLGGVGHIYGAVGLACHGYRVLILEGYLGNLSSRKLALSVQLLGVRIFEVGACRCVIPRASACAADIAGGRTRHTGAVIAEGARCDGAAEPVGHASLVGAAVVAHVDVVGCAAVETCGGVACGALPHYGRPGGEVGHGGVADDDVVLDEACVGLGPRDGEAAARHIGEDHVGGGGARLGLHYDGVVIVDVGVLGKDAVDHRRGEIVGRGA